MTRINSRQRRREATYRRGYEDGKRAALSAAEPVKPYGYVYESTVRYCDGRAPHRKVDFFYTKKNISDDDIEEFEISETAVFDRPQQPAPSVAVKALDTCAVDLLLYNLLREAIQEGMDKATNPDWVTKDFTHSGPYVALRSALSALSAQVQDVAGFDLTLSALQSAHVARQEEWCPDVKPDLSFRGNELGGECGEAQNVIKKLERERHGWRGSRDTVEHLAEELADVIHCTMLVAITAGIDLQQSVVSKFNDTSTKNGLSTMLPAAPAKQECGE